MNKTLTTLQRFAVTGGLALAIGLTTFAAFALEAPADVLTIKPVETAIELLKDREIRETVSVDALGTLRFSAPEESNALFHPTVTVTVLADSGLPPALLEAMAEEVLLLKNLPVRILFQGLPMTRLPDGRLSADRPEIARRLSPLLERGLPSAVDPTVFREVSTAFSAYEKSEAKTKSEASVRQPFTLPSVLVTVDGPDTREPRHEVVIGTVLPLRALREVALRSPSRLMRRDLRAGLAALGVAHRLDVNDPDTASVRPRRPVTKESPKGD